MRDKIAEQEEFIKAIKEEFYDRENIREQLLHELK